MKQEKETICWNCQNVYKCSWGIGEPVKGWKATPTVIVQEGNSDGKPHITHSFLVEDCPLFKPDTKRRVFFKEIAEIIGVSERTAYRIKKKGIKRIKDLLAEKGYKLYVYRNTDGRHIYYVEAIKGE